MGSFLYHSDPTLTVESVVQVMKAVDEKNRLSIWALILFSENTGRILRSETKSDTFYAEIYVICHPHSSWKHFAKQLYQQGQVGAVEKIRDHLPLRGDINALLIRIGQVLFKLSSFIN